MTRIENRRKEALRLEAGEDDEGRRLDRVLRKALPALPLSALHRLFRKGAVRLNAARAMPESRVHKGDIILACVSEKTAPPKSAFSHTKPAGLNIIFENDAILALNKPAALVTHGEDSLESRVLAYLLPRAKSSLSFRPGPLHRLDRETSGLILFSKNLLGARYVTEGLRTGLFKKSYLVLLRGELDSEELWEDYLVRDGQNKRSFAGDSRDKTARRAITRISPVETRRGITLAKAEIFTGRTHQIRAQAALRGCPVAGDVKYGGGGGRMFLHSWLMEFPQNNPAGLPPILECAPDPLMTRSLF
ncbi:MAG: RluA family pseudouridine synthase [Spirochaetaceae bacterium]|jgi:23S rRNA pseudouridine955/2504/2580 synthase|nr:RluA family pseudouridine synthase [Spirochaetaceae bacterium]